MPEEWDILEVIPHWLHDAIPPPQLSSINFDSQLSSISGA